MALNNYIFLCFEYVVCWLFSYCRSLKVYHNVNAKICEIENVYEPLQSDKWELVQLRCS